MEYKCLFGSKLLKFSNANDEDWAIFVDKKAPEISDKRYRSIPFHKMIINHFISGEIIDGDIYDCLFLYQLSAPFHEDDEYPFDYFNILHYKKVWIKHLKAFVNSKENEQRFASKEILHKQLYNLVYQYHMIKENTHWISDEARVDVQKIHDREMPSSYFYELRDKINSLEDGG